MITENQLDAQLDALQACEPGPEDRFASTADFKARFFARAHAIEAATPKSQPEMEPEEDDGLSIWDRIRTAMHPQSPRAGNARSLGVVNHAMLSKTFGSLIQPLAMEKSFCCEMSEPDCFDGGDFDFGTTARPVDFDTEEYRSVAEKPFVAAARNPLSTFGADVDTAGYTTARRMILENNRLPAADSVRLDEFLNYFRYDYPAPADGQDLAPHFEMANTPWAPDHRLLLVGIQARDIAREQLPPAHYVFLVDNSGSMSDVMEMVKDAMSLLAKQLRPQDKVSLVTYGGEVKVLLEGSGDVQAILAAIAKLEAEGCTPGGKAIQRAYRLAHEHFIPGGNNRIVLISDGDFNVGASSEAALTSMVEKERGKGIYFSVIGAGCGNYKDNHMKALANKGDGNYIYIDTPAEARRAFAGGLTGQMFVLAHDVKFQLEFNPARVYAYRLLGYEMRHMEDSDFRDDTKDSGEIGVGQQVTALYELVMTDAPAAAKAQAVPDAPPLRYSTVAATGSAELLDFHLRYQRPEGGGAFEQEVAVPDAAPGANLIWAAAVAEFALLLRNSPYKGAATYDEAIRLARQTLGPETDDDRLGFITMARRAADLAKN